MNVAELRKSVSIYDLANLDGSTKVLALTPNGDRPTLSFIGMHCGARANLPADIPGLEKTVGIDGEVLSKVLGFAEGEIELSIKGNRLSLTGAGTSSKLGIIEVEPVALRTEKPLARFKVDTTVFSSALSILGLVASTRMTRPVMTGANLSCSAKGVRALATDAARAAVSRMTPTAYEGADASLTVPIADVQIGLQVVGDDPWIEVHPNHLCLRSDDAEVWVSVLQGDFPPIGSQLPKDFAYVLPIPREALARAIRAAGIFNRSGLLTLVLAEGKATFVSADTQVGEFALDFALEGEFEEGTTLTFDAAYLDVATRFGVDTLKLSFIDRTTPFMLSGGRWFYWMSAVVVN